MCGEVAFQSCHVIYNIALPIIQDVVLTLILLSNLGVVVMTAYRHVTAEIRTLALCFRSLGPESNFPSLG